MKGRLGRALLLGVLMLTSPTEAAQHADPGDWAQLARYRKANVALPPPGPGEVRVVFMGDSILEGWARLQPAFFADPNRINRAISGQTSAQMLVRFRSDVIALQPRVVVILAGTNDIAGNTGAVSDAEVVGNIASMSELARAHGIRVVLVSLTPADRFPWNPAVKPAARIVEVNRLLADYARREGLGWVDLHTLLADDRRGLPRRYSDDGVHPTSAAYRVMRPPLDEAIAAALR